MIYVVRVYSSITTVLRDQPALYGNVARPLRYQHKKKVYLILVVFVSEILAI